MEKKDWLAENFAENRQLLMTIAFRMLGSHDEAEDAVQEAWIRLARSKSEDLENLKGWLTTIVTRVCLDVLRSRKSRREEPLDQSVYEIPNEGSGNPEEDVLIGDSIGPALLLVLDLLSPNERVAFVLHDLFDLSFEEIALMIDRTETATRQLASRARRRVRGAGPLPEDLKCQQEVVSAFFAASRNGNFDAILKLLHPNVVLRADETAVKIAEANESKGAPLVKREIRGARNVADIFNGKAAEAKLALVNGLPGATWAPGGKPLVAFSFSFKEGTISAIDIIMDPKRLPFIDIAIIDKER